VFINYVSFDRPKWFMPPGICFLPANVLG